MSVVAFSIVACLTVGVFVLSSKNKRLVNPLFIFLVIWSIVLFLSTLQLYNIDPASDKAYIAILLMVVSFATGYGLYRFFKKGMVKEASKNDAKLSAQKVADAKIGINDLRIKILLAGCILLIIFNIIDCIIAWRYISEGTPVWQVRNWSLEPVGASNPLLDRRSFVENIIRNIILAPLSTAVPPVTAYFFMKSKDKKLRISCLVVSLTMLVTSSLAGGGGRLGFIYYVGCFVLAFIFLKTNNKNIKKKAGVSKWSLGLLSLGVLSIIALTTFRTGFGNVVKQTYTYFAVPPTLLTKWMPKIEDAPKTYGLTSFFGVHSYFYRTLETIGMKDLVPSIYNESFKNILNAETFLGVGYGTANAFVTPVYYFMADGGYAAIVILSGAFGYVCAMIFWKFIQKRTASRFIFYVLVLYGVSLSFIRVQTTSPTYILAFVYIWLLFSGPNLLRKYNEKRQAIN